MDTSVNSKMRIVMQILLVICTAGASVFARQGDVDGNGTINIIDAMLLAQYAAGTYDGPVDREIGDVNWDGKINIIDAMLVAQFSAGTIDDFPCPNPWVTGYVDYGMITYASAGVQKTGRYMNPSPMYTVERRIDIPQIGDDPLVDESVWDFSQHSMPVNGIAVIPEGNGPFPVVMFVHGNYSTRADSGSEEGYLYLCELLASYGIIGVTIDQNFLIDYLIDTKNMAARSLLLLEHLKQFRIWNSQPGHPLAGKVDMSKIMVAGQMAGATAARDALIFNGMDSIEIPDESTVFKVPVNGTGCLGPYDFGIAGLIEMAPSGKSGYFSSQSIKRPINTNILVMQGAKDEEYLSFSHSLSPLTFLSHYDSTNLINMTEPTAQDSGLKSLAWIYEGTNAFFNSKWEPSIDPDSIPTTITRAEQVQITKVFISAFAQNVLLGKERYLPVLESSRSAGLYLPENRTVVTQYQAKERLYINHFNNDKDFTTLSPPFLTSGYARWEGTEILIWEVDPSVYRISDMPVMSRALDANWYSADCKYESVFNGQGLNADGYKCIAFKVMNSSESMYAMPPDALPDLDFTIVITDMTGNSASVAVSSLARIPFPAESRYDPQIPGYNWTSAMQTVRLPIATLEQNGIDTAHIESIGFVFDKFPYGHVYVDDIQLSN